MADGALEAGFLGVRRSLSGRAWRWRPADAALIRDHQMRHGLSEPLARALAARGIDTAGAPDYLTPTLKAQFPDPSTFADMDLAASILVDAVETSRPTAVFADYDVDGASSAAQLVRWFRAMGRELAIYVPDRIIEGYGPSPAAFRHLQEQGADLVVTVDCGAAATDALLAARDIGLDVVVIDHHLMRGDPPPAEPRGAAQGAVPGPSGARHPPVARSGRHGRCLRRDEPHGLQPRHRRPGPEDHVGLGQPGAEGAARRRQVPGTGHNLPRRLHPRPADQRRRPDRPFGPGRPPAVDRRPGRGA
jgi:DHH family